MKRKSRLGCKNMTSEEREAKDSCKRKRKEDLPKRSVGPRSKKHNEEFPYIDRLSVENLCKDAHNTVLCDTGRRDLLYCMHEVSTSYAPRTYRYTADQRRNELKVKKAEGRRGHVKTKTSGHPKSYGCDLRHSMPYRVSNRLPRVLEDSGAHTPLLRDFYAQSHFRQWKWKTYQYDQQSNDRSVSKIWQHFGPDPLPVIGDHLSPNTRFHAPVRGLGMKRMLQREGIRIVHIDEYRTSQVCPCCDGKTETFRLRRNPRP